MIGWSPIVLIGSAMTIRRRSTSIPAAEKRAAMSALVTEPNSFPSGLACMGKVRSTAATWRATCWKPAIAFFWISSITRRLCSTSFTREVVASMALPCGRR